MLTDNQEDLISSLLQNFSEYLKKNKVPETTASERCNHIRILRASSIDVEDFSRRLETFYISGKGDKPRRHSDRVRQHRDGLEDVDIANARRLIQD